MSKSETLGARAAANELGVNLIHIYQLCWAQKLRGAEKINGRWAIPAEAVAAWKQHRRRPKNGIAARS